MTVNRTTLLDLPLPVSGTESGTWGDTTNNGLTQYLDIAIAGMSNLTSANFTAGALTIETTEGDSSATNISATSAQYAGFRVTSLAVNSTITVGNTGTTLGRSYRLINADSTYTLTFKATGQTGVTLQPGQSAVVAFNGTDYVFVGSVGPGSSLNTPLAVIGNATAGAEIRLPEDTDNGSNYVAIKAPDNIASNATLTAPAVTDTLATIGTAQTFTAAQTFSAANAIRSEAASTQDAVVIAGRAGGTNSYAVTLSPTTLSSNTTLTLPNATDTLATIGTAQIFTADQTFRAANAIRSEAASTQDAIVIAGRAGGTNSYAVTLAPTTLSSNTTLTLPNATDTVAVIGTAQTFTAAQTFQAANAIRSEAASTQDAVVIAGRAGGTSSYAVTLAPTTLSSNTTLTLPNVTDTLATIGTAQTFTAAQTFQAANAIRSEAASTQDAVVIAGRAGGTSSYAATITPTTLSASRTITLPNADIDFTTGLGVANGGTGTTTLTANNVILGNGTSAVQFVAPGANGNVLTSNGTTWTSAASSASLLGDTDSASPFETSLGYQAGNVNTGAYNTFIGYQAGLSNTTGTHNVSVGYQALDANTTGTYNVAIGSQALGANTTGTYNVAIGSLALSANTTNNENIAIGVNALNANTADGNIGIGHSALSLNSIGTGNVGIGRAALGLNTTGSNNTAVGYAALDANTTGSNNIAVGYNALGSSTTTNGCVAVGYDALSLVTVASGLVGIGYQALSSNTTGSDNTAIGLQAGRLLTTGADNTAVGSTALTSATTARYLCAYGKQSLLSNTTGDGSTALGYQSLFSNTTASNLVAIGREALYSNTTGVRNTAVGYLALRGNTTGTDNTAVGDSAGNAVTTGAQNTLLGVKAGFSGTNNLTTGNNNTILGYNAASSTATVNNEITLGNSNVATLRCQVTTITALSDVRDKTNINELPAGLGFVKALRPVEFDWNMRDGGKVGEHDTGFIAQDLKAAQEATGINIPGLVYESNPDRLEAGYGKLIPVLVKAIQELSAEVESLKSKLKRD